MLSSLTFCQLMIAGVACYIGAFILVHENTVLLDQPNDDDSGNAEGQWVIAGVRGLASGWSMTQSPGRPTQPAQARGMAS